VIVTGSAVTRRVVVSGAAGAVCRDCKACIAAGAV
jgi:hypothetical protein